MKTSTTGEGGGEEGGEGEGGGGEGGGGLGEGGGGEGEGEGGGATQQACLHFAESRSSVFLQSFAHFLWPTPPQPGFALGLHRRCTVFESSVVHVVGSSSAAQLTDSMGKGGGNEGGLGGGGQLPEAHPIAQASEA